MRKVDVLTVADIVGLKEVRNRWPICDAGYHSESPDLGIIGACTSRLPFSKMALAKISIPCLTWKMGTRPANADSI